MRLRPPAAGDDKRETAEREGVAGLPNGRRMCRGAPRAQSPARSKLSTRNIHFYKENFNDEFKIIIEDYFL
jgi:hypothetical protein